VVYGTFAINLPFTIGMLGHRGSVQKVAVKIRNVLAFAAANFTGAVNH
jgi:hypothetical protein